MHNNTDTQITFMARTNYFYILVLTGLLAFKSDSDQFSWSAERRLIWADFKGKPVASMQAAALTYSDISVKASSDDNGLVQVSVINFFDKNKSWTKNKTSAELLAHEQLHFDITEVYTRKLREKLNAIANPDAIRSGKFAKESSKIMKEWKECQNNYDNETDHGTVASKQSEWQKKVATWLIERP